MVADLNTRRAVWRASLESKFPPVLFIIVLVRVTHLYRVLAIWCVFFSPEVVSQAPSADQVPVPLPGVHPSALALSRTTRSGAHTCTRVLFCRASGDSAPGCAAR